MAGVATIEEEVKKAIPEEARVIEIIPSTDLTERKVKPILLMHYIVISHNGISKYRLSGIVLNGRPTNLHELRSRGGPTEINYIPTIKEVEENYDIRQFYH